MAKVDALTAWVANGDCWLVGLTAKGTVVFPFATETNGKKYDPLTGNDAGWNAIFGMIVIKPVPSPIVVTGTYNTVDIWYI